MKKVEAVDELLRRQLHAVYCPTEMEYFIATGEEVSSRKIISPFSKTVIEPSDLIVYPLNIENTIQWKEKDLSEFYEANTELIEDLASTNYVKFSELGPVETIEMIEEEAHHLSEIAKNTNNETVAHAYELSSLQQKTSFQNSYIEAHKATYTVRDGVMLVFTVGPHASVVFASPVWASPNGFKKTAETIGLIAAVVLEVLLIVSIVMDVKGRPEKTAEAIQEALQNSELVAKILQFIKNVKDGSWTVMKFAYEVLKALDAAGNLGAIIGAFMAGALGVAALLWLIASILLKMAAPWLVAGIKAVQIAAAAAGIIKKISALVEGD